MQAEGLKYNPHLMLIDDADRPAKWYFQIEGGVPGSQADRRASETSDVRPGHAEVEKLRTEQLRTTPLPASPSLPLAF